MRKGLVELTVVFLFAWLGFFFPPMRGMSPTSDVFVFPLGYHDGQTYTPRIMRDNQGNLIENTDFDAQNPDLSAPSSCFGPPMRLLHHAGEDLYRNGQDPIEGAEVVAVADGIVIEYKHRFNYPGKAVVIEHTLSDGTRVYSVYMHLRDVQVQEGEHVLRGQTIGYVIYQPYDGNYPEYHSPDDSHLHFEIRYFADASQVYLEQGYPQCAIWGDKAGRGYTPPDVHADTWGYTDPTDFILAHQPPTPSPIPSPTVTLPPTPVGTPTPWPTPPPDLTPGPGEYLAQCTFSLSVSQGNEALHWCGPASTANRAAFLSWSGTYSRPQAFAGAVFRVLRSGPEIGIFNAYDLAYEKYDPGPDGGSGSWGETVNIPDAHWGMGAEGNNVPGPLIWLVSRCSGNICGNAQVSGVLYYIAPGTPTPIPSSTPTSTPTMTPTPTPTPRRWAPAEQVLMQDEPAPKRKAFSELLSRIRDQILLRDPKGKAYVQMIYRHAPEITKLLAEDERFRAKVKALVVEIQPLLEATIAEQPSKDAPRLSAAWVERALEVLAEMEPRVSPELREEIRWWKIHLPDFVGKTGLEIWGMLPERTK